jgi:hypothetical protein
LNAQAESARSSWRPPGPPRLGVRLQRKNDVSKKSSGINPDLERAVSDLLKQVMSDASVDLEIKLKVIDRAMNLEKIKQKMSDDAYGSGFLTEDDV